eukprot:m.63899 g.63899  ORF g.63899 m.63899 type:complete len:79 (-) comp13515_c0_seq1:2051-2287(-)
MNATSIDAFIPTNQPAAAGGNISVVDSSRIDELGAWTWSQAKNKLLRNGGSCGKPLPTRDNWMQIELKDEKRAAGPIE